VKILHVIRGLDYHGTARQLVLLVRRLPRAEVESLVCVLAGPGPLLGELKTGAIQVEALNWRRWLDPRPLWELRRLLWEYQPSVVHVWGQEALRVFRLAGAGWRGPVALGAPAVTRKSLGWLETRLLRDVDRVVVTGDVEAERCLKLGIKNERVFGVSPAVALPGEGVKPAPLPDSVPAEKARFVIAMGALERHKGFRDAIWAFGILRFLYDDLRLLLIGAGPDRARLEEFARSTNCLPRVHFLGERADGPSLLAHAEVVWATDLADGGVNVVLEAMAAGRPVIATRQPGLAEVIVNGQTGFLVPPGNPAELARQARTLLDDPALGERLGSAGRQRVAQHFRVDELARHLSELYQEMCGH
jgi:glycosyltransferase involved in cell wall biosynthesis